MRVNFVKYFYKLNEEMMLMNKPIELENSHRIITTE